MKCPLCDSSDFEVIGKTANGDRKYSCHVCNNVFINGNSEIVVLPTINFLRFRNKPLIKIRLVRMRNQALELKNSILDLGNTLTSNYNQAKSKTKNKVKINTKIFTGLRTQVLNSGKLFSQENQVKVKNRILNGLTNKVLSLQYLFVFLSQLDKI